MNASNSNPAAEAVPPVSGALQRRKPRVLIAGEFSAGKTQLINGLLGSDALPSNVTSTSLPPIWLVEEDVDQFRMDTDGTTHALHSIDEVDVGDTHFCLKSHSSPILRHFDLIDTPGNSDPNIPAECWERMLSYADAVVWCSNAVQAWRQSEKSVWAEMPDHLVRTSTLLITHADRLPDQRSADKVMRRVRRDAGRYFSEFILASLLSETDIELIANHLVSLTSSLEDLPGAEQTDVAEARANAVSLVQDVAPDDELGVRPRRVERDGEMGAERPVPESGPLEGAADLAAAGAVLREAAEEQPAPIGPMASLWASMMDEAPFAGTQEVREMVDRLIREAEMKIRMQQSGAAPQDTTALTPAS